MTNKEKIKLVQEHKAQLVENCKHCLNCTAWVPELSDWDVMQSGYRAEQLYPREIEILEMHDVPCTTIVIEG